MSYAIGVDLGGTYIKAGVVTEKGKIIKMTKVPTVKNREAIIETVLTVIGKLYDKSKIKGIGIGVPGIVDVAKGIIINTPNLPLHDLPIRDIIKKRFKKNVRIENDANCFGLAEIRQGVARKFNYVLCITLGTGVGSSFIINKKLFRGKGKAPELGHTTINFKGTQCSCGNYGCVEEYLCTRGLLRLAKSHGIKLEDTLDLFLEAERNNKKAINVFEEYGTMVGIALANFVNTFDPDAIVLGGQITGAWRFFHKTMIREMNRRSFIRPCKVFKSEQKGHAGIIGAGSLIV